MISIEEAVALTISRCDFALQRHLAHVAKAMETLAVHLGYSEEKEKWYLTGLLHDIDWNDTINQPEDHCGPATMDYLKENGVIDEICLCIQSHYDLLNIPRDNDYRKALFAVDELSGFCVAVALMRPTKMIGMSSKSVIKKMKDKSFAAAVSREDMKMCEPYFNLTPKEMLEILLPSFYEIAPDWELV